jgi:hypothetical protein
MLSSSSFRLMPGQTAKKQGGLPQACAFTPQECLVNVLQQLLHPIVMAEKRLGIAALIGLRLRQTSNLQKPIRWKRSG